MWLDTEEIHRLVARHNTPLYIYDTNSLKKRAQELLALSAPYGLTVRYAMKANPYPEVIAIFNRLGLHFDASSSYEVSELLEQGIKGGRISLSSQQPAHNLPELLAANVQYVATSLHQLECFAEVAKTGSSVGLRVNPGVGSGHNNRNTTGGPNASFGLWHEYVNEALIYAHKKHITVDRLHVHMGSGADPSIWGAAIEVALAICKKMPDVVTLDIGGGYKVRRADGEVETDMQQVLQAFSEKIQLFYKTTGRQIRLEIEPGTWLVAHAGCLATEIVDIVDTGKDGHVFLRTNTGMNDLMRPTMYGAIHEMTVLNTSSETQNYVVVGHNCETGDILTPAPGKPEMIKPRQLRKANIGDLLVIHDTGAYGASFRARGYNAFPEAKEVLI